jgi:hypothetical protein
MRRIAIASIIASLLALACGSGQEAAGTPDVEAAAKTPAPAAPSPELTPVPAPVQPPQPTPPPAPAEDDYGHEFCDTIIPCFQELDFAGSFTADVTVDIEPDGKVSAVSLTGDAPKAIQTCITDAIKNITLADYNGKPGRTRCTKSGQLMKGTQMIMSDHTYEVREPSGAAPAEAEPAGAAASDAKAAKAG